MGFIDGEGFAGIVFFLYLVKQNSLPGQGGEGGGQILLSPPINIRSYLNPIQPPPKHPEIALPSPLPFILHHGKHHLLPPPAAKLLLGQHLPPARHHFAPGIAKRATAQRAQDQHAMGTGSRDAEHDAHLLLHERARAHVAVSSELALAALDRRVPHGGHADDADDGQVARALEVQQRVAGGEALAEDEDGGAVDSGFLRERVEVALESEGEAGAVAEGFFLRQGSLEPAPAAVLGVGHVED